MSRYQAMFGRLAEQQQGAFVPFLMVGDPTPEQFIRNAQTAIDQGADALELGFAFSDPIADGPVIQRTITRLLAKEYRIETCFEAIESVRQYNQQVPIGLLIYVNLVFAFGVDAFFRRCRESGVDSVLIADLPLEEAMPFYLSAQEQQVDLVMICPPNADQQTIKLIAEYASGYTYLVSRDGVTGDNASLQQDLQHRVNMLNEAGAPPAIAGFGISQPEHIGQVLNAGAQGAIAGSSICRIIEQNVNDFQRMQKDLAAYIGKMKEATTKTENLC